MWKFTMCIEHTEQKNYKVTEDSQQKLELAKHHKLGSQSFQKVEVDCQVLGA